MAHYACPHCSEPLDDEDMGLRVCPCCKRSIAVYVHEIHFDKQRTSLPVPAMSQNPPPPIPKPEGKVPLFTQQHHDAIIQVLHTALEGAPEYEYDGINSLKEDLGIMFANDNPEFDGHKFDDA